MKRQKKEGKKIPVCFNPLQPSLNLLSAKSVCSVCCGRFSAGRMYRCRCSPFLRPEPPLGACRSEPSRRPASIVSSPRGAGVSKTSWQAIIIASRRLWQNNNPSIVHSLPLPGFEHRGWLMWRQTSRIETLTALFYPTFINCVWSSAHGGFGFRWTGWRSWWATHASH